MTDLAVINSSAAVQASVVVSLVESEVSTQVLGVVFPVIFGGSMIRHMIMCRRGYNHGFNI
jgi:hypothetical protein